MAPEVKVPQDQSLIERYDALMKRRDALNAKKIELTTTFNHHKDEYNDALTRLKEEFKVTSLKEAYSLLDELRAQAQKELDELSKALSEFDDIIAPAEGGESNVLES